MRIRSSTLMVLPLVLACGDAGLLVPVDDRPFDVEIVDCDGVPTTATPLGGGDFVRIAIKIPGFGGYFLDGETLVVFLKGLRGRDVAEPILRNHLRITRRELADREIRWVQGRFDWRQLVVWQRCLGDRLRRKGINTPRPDHTRNRLVVFASAEWVPPAAERVLLTETSVPLEAVVFERRGPFCPRTLRPSVIVEVRDAGGEPAALGATVTIRKPGLEASTEGSGPLWVEVFADNQGGDFEVRVTRPGYTTALFPRVQVPASACGVTEPAVVSATITRLPDADG